MALPANFLELLCPCFLCATYCRVITLTHSLASLPGPLVQAKLKPTTLLLAMQLAALSRMSIKVLTPVTTVPCFSLMERMVICMLILHTTTHPKIKLLVDNLRV